MSMELSDVLLAFIAARVFGCDVAALLRKAAAVGVRAGISELRRHTTEGEDR